MRDSGQRVGGETVELIEASPRAAERKAAQESTHAFCIHSLEGKICVDFLVTIRFKYA